MEYLQYLMLNTHEFDRSGFKPYYKWNTFNTEIESIQDKIKVAVLNLIINGIPSIRNRG